MDEEHKSEGIESLIYPSDDMLARLGVERKDSANSDAVFAELKAIVDKVNKTLQPYARISKITVLQEPLEMTTTKKVKRNLLNVKNTEKAPAKKTAKSAAKKTTAKPASTVKTKTVAKPAAEKKTVAVKKTVKASAKTEVKKAPAKTAAKTQTKTAAKKAPAEKTKKTKK